MIAAPDERIAVHVMQYGDTSTALWDGQIGGGGMSVPDGDRSTPPVPSVTDNGTTWAYWGDDDRLPRTMREKVEGVPIAGATIDKKIKMMAGNGLVYYRQEDLQRDAANAQPVRLPEVDDWLEANRIETHYLPAQIADYCLPYNAFSQVVLDVAHRRVTNLFHMGAEHCRLKKARPETGNVPESVFHSYHFSYNTAQAKSNRMELPLYKWWEPNWVAGLQGDTFAWHTAFPTPGMIYYARAWWLGLFKEGGWMDVSGQVSKIVAAMQKNQVSLKYIIYLPQSYFRALYASWDTMPHDERREKVQAKVDQINKYLAGTDNAMKSISCLFDENEVSGIHTGKIEVVAVDDKTKVGTWVPDSYAADAQIVQGLGMDPSQIGLAPEGGKMGAGSGSDKRESYNLMITLNTPDQRLILEPLNWVSRFNGWGVRFLMDHTAHTTTNNKESGLVASATPTGLPQQ